MNTQETISELTRCMKLAAEREEFESAHDFKRIRDGIIDDQTIVCSGEKKQPEEEEEEDFKPSFGCRFSVLMDMNHIFAMIIDSEHPSFEEGKSYNTLPNLHESPEVVVVARDALPQTLKYFYGLCSEYNRPYDPNENKE